MTVIIDIDHEAGDLSEYTSTVTDSGDLSVAAGAALAGTNYGLSCLIDDATGIYGTIGFSGPYPTTGIFRARFYIDPNSLTMANGNNFRLLAINNSTPASVAEVRLGYTTGTGHTIAAMIVDDAAAESFTTYYGISDAPHYIEIQLLRATGESANDGSIQLWIDGVSKQTVGGKDNYTRFNTLRLVNFGAVSGIDAGTSGTFYLDELVANDDGSEIGPVSSSQAYTLTCAQGSYTLTGQAAGLTSARTMVAAQGSYTLTGQAANFLRGYTLAAGQGTYTLTGQAAAFLRGYMLAAGQGAYVLSGQAAELTWSPATGTSIIVDIDHETGDLSQYTSTVTDSGDLSVAAGAALAGTGYGLSCLVNDTTAIYGIKSLGSPDSSNVFRARFYIDPNTVTISNGGIVTVFWWFNNSIATVGHVQLRYSTASGYRVACILTKDDGTNSGTGLANITDAPHYIEVMWTKATTADANDGRIDWWVDGVSQTPVTNSDSFTRWGAGLKQVRLGRLSVSGSCAGTFYLDELVVNNDGGLIGPVPMAYTLTAAYGSYALTGQAVGLTSARRMIAAQGAYTLTGQAATFSYTARADFGEYDAVLTDNAPYSATLSDSGPYSATPTDSGPYTSTVSDARWRA